LKKFEDLICNRKGIRTCSAATRRVKLEESKIMARILHGKDGAAVALKLFLMLVTLLVVGCRFGCDAAANDSSMAPEVVSDRGFALLQRPAMEKVAESGDQVRPIICCYYNPTYC
jgi:hypothetical protein